MGELKIWFLDVGHGDCAYIALPNGARMMIDCGGGDNNWPSKMLKYYEISKTDNPAAIPNESKKYGLDSLTITHPHGDHIGDIEAIHDEIGFFMLRGGYSKIIDQIKLDKIDFRKRGQSAAKKFVEIVKQYTHPIDTNKDRIAAAAPECTVSASRFIEYSDDIDLNELSWFVSFEIGGHKVLFTGDMTSDGINKILASDRASEFRTIVNGTTILKVPHHGRENGCSQEMFNLFGDKPLLCIASDEVLNDRNEGTSNIDWYTERTSDKKVNIDGVMQNRKVLTTRNDKDIYLKLDDNGNLYVGTNCFKDKKDEILNS